VQGHFDLQMFDAPDLTPALVEAWKKQGLDPIAEIERRYEELGRWSADNLVIGTTPGFYYYHCWSGATPYSPMNANSSLLWGLALTTLATEPGYQTEYLSAYLWGSPENIPNKVSSGGGKSIIDDDIVSPVIDIDPDGRESMFMSFKYLFYPGQAVSDLIRSVEIWYFDTGGNQGARVARVRIPDSNGVPVTLHLGPSSALMVGYTYRLVSV
jgi:hypothetical protein